MHQESGFVVSKHSRRLQEYTADTSNEVPDQLFERIEQDVNRHGHISEADKRRLVAAYTAATDIEMELPGCAACGKHGPTKPASTKFFLADLAVDHWLRLTTDAEQNLKNMPTVALVDEKCHACDVFLGCLRSYCVTSTDGYFHVHPELLGGDEAGNEYVCLCHPCAAAARDAEARPPPQSIAAGRDFGLFSRINVDMPNETEEMALVDVRTYSMVAKVHIPNVCVTTATRVVLRDHMIAFLHDGPAVVSKHFDEARVEGLSENIQLVFVGDAGNQTQLERKALRHCPTLQLRPHVLALQSPRHSTRGSRYTGQCLAAHTRDLRTSRRLAREILGTCAFRC